MVVIKIKLLQVRQIAEIGNASAQLVARKQKLCYLPTCTSHPKPRTRSLCDIPAGVVFPIRSIRAVIKLQQRFAFGTGNLRDGGAIGRRLCRAGKQQQASEKLKERFHGVFSCEVEVKETDCLGSWDVPYWIEVETPSFTTNLDSGQLLSD